jgi:hypothetical protein
MLNLNGQYNNVNIFIFVFVLLKSPKSALTTCGSFVI